MQLNAIIEYQKIFSYILLLLFVLFLSLQFSSNFCVYILKGSNLELYLWEFMLQFIVFLLFIANICSNNIIYLSIYIYPSIYRYNFKTKMHKTFAIKLFRVSCLRGKSEIYATDFCFEIEN